MGINGSAGTISNSAFTSNNAHVGGAIFIFPTGVVNTIFNTTFANNSATSSNGGAINNTGEIDVIDSSMFSRNAALNGGALSLAQQGTGPVGTISSISNSIFANNTAATFGGAISSIVTTEITRPQSIGTISLCRFSNNFGFLGGAVGLQGVALTSIDQSTFDHNRATVSGGAIFSGSSKIGIISNSTFNNNQALSAQDGDGGALALASENFNGDPNLNVPSTIGTIENSTFSNNSANRFGGAIAMSSESGAGSAVISTFSNSTIAGNNAQVSGGGFYSTVPGSIADLSSTIIATNTAVTSGPDAFAAAGVITQENFNLIGNNANSAFIAGLPNANESYVGTPTNPINPSLAPLANNGGPTQTQALLTGSVAIDHGDNFLALLYDQRGPNFYRTSGPQTDIGAYEVQQPDICPDCPLCPECPGCPAYDDGVDDVGGAVGIFPAPIALPPLVPPFPAIAAPAVVPAEVPASASAPALAPTRGPVQATVSVASAESAPTPAENAKSVSKSGCSSTGAENNLTLLLIVGVWLVVKQRHKKALG